MHAGALTEQAGGTSATQVGTNGLKTGGTDWQVRLWKVLLAGDLEATS